LKVEFGAGWPWYQSRGLTTSQPLDLGETCIVASLDIAGDITFDWYKFSREIVKPDDLTGQPYHAYFGEHFKTETLSRDEARRNAVYSKFFNVNGHFKRPSVMHA
jgi:hypothetical protein